MPGGKSFLKFNYLTLIPFDAKCLDVDRLDAAERAWVDAYQAEVRARLSPLLQAPEDAQALAWLEAMTEPL